MWKKENSKPQIKVKLELNDLLRNNSRSKNHQVILDFLDKHIYMIGSNPEVTFWTTLHTSWWRYCTNSVVCQPPIKFRRRGRKRSGRRRRKRRKKLEEMCLFLVGRDSVQTRIIFSLFCSCFLMGWNFVTFTGCWVFRSVVCLPDTALFTSAHSSLLFIFRWF